MTAGVATATLLPERAPRRREEADLQRAVHEYLLWALPSDAVHFAIPNGLMRSRKAAARAIGEGVRAGVPDLLVIHRGHPVFLELKSGRGVMSEVQRNMMRKLGYCGADVVCCRSLPCVEESLRELGVPLRATVL